ncbi:MAG: hypothetical protein ACE37M_08270 [Henriciella sp.]
MPLETEANFHAFESLNPFEFNKAFEDRQLAPGTSQFPADLVRSSAEAWFNTACDRINSKTYSPLCDDMIANRCNKPVAHNYTQVYHEILSPFRHSKLAFAEIGIGTPNQDVPSAMADSYSFGASLRGWRQYLRNSETIVNGGDIDPRVLFEEDRIKTNYINQLNPVQIAAYLKDSDLASGIDFILDDGLHEFRSNLCLLSTVWPYIKQNGLYLIEDMSDKTFKLLVEMISSLSLGADCAGFELPSPIKSDNRIIVIQKR